MAWRRFIFLLISATSAVSQPVAGQLRYFMQTTPSPATAIPYGKGKPLVVLHGGGVGSIYEMAQFIDSLAKSYQVIALSTRGHGRSEIGHTPLTYEQNANDVYAVMQAVTSDSVIVLGFSDGAYAGYKLANMYPARVSKLMPWEPVNRYRAYAR